MSGSRRRSLQYETDLGYPTPSFAADAPFLMKEIPREETGAPEIQRGDPQISRDKDAATKKSASSVVAFAPRRAWADVKQFGWSGFGARFLVLVWIPWNVAILIYLGASSTWIIRASVYYGTACHPDGSFAPVGGSYNIWAGSGFFQITFGFGQLSFTAAKVIDIMWDVLVGRIGQTALIYLSWRAFTDYLATAMASSPVTYRSFWIIFLQNEPTLMSTIQLIRDFVKRRSLKSRTISVFLILSTVFILAFPTLVSAMTGYAATNKAYVRVSDDNLIPFEDFNPVLYVVHDGSRVNLTDDYVVTYVPPTDDEHGDLIYSENEALIVYSGSPTMSMISNVSNYVQDYGFFGLNNTETIWQHTVLPSPALNISAFWLGSGNGETADFPFGSTWIDPRTGKHPFTNISNIAYQESDKTYLLSSLLADGLCEPVANTYQWGFSFLQLYIITILFLLWSVGMSIVWAVARVNLPVAGWPEVPRRWRAVLEMAEPMRRDFTEADIDPYKLTDSELKDAIRDRLRGGQMAFAMPPAAIHDNTLRRAFFDFVKSNKWWCLPLVALFLLPILLSIHRSHNLPEWVTWLASLWFGVAFAVMFGTTTSSRLVMVLFWSVVGGIAAVIVWTQLKDYYDYRWSIA